MMPIRALVVDDEEHARESVRALLAEQPRWRVIAECDTASALRRALVDTPVDVVFLDIRLPDADGMTVARALRESMRSPLVVFTTAFEQYAVDAFEVHAIDYLLKPFDDARFQAALRRAEQALSANQRGDERYRQRLAIRSIGRVQFVEVADIDWLEASGNYVEIHAGKESFLHRERMHVLEAQLDPAEFVRIHRSIMVNRAAIAEIRPIAAGDHAVILRGGQRLRLSRTYRSAIESLEGRR
jgi:two-component system LytT family response regulator